METTRQPPIARPRFHSRVRNSTYCQESRLGRVERGDLHGRVDVEHALGAARRPDGALDAEDVALEVVLVDRARELLGPHDLWDG